MPTVKQPIRLGRIALRPSRLGDVEAVRQILHDPEVRRFLCDDRVLSEEAILALLAESDALDDQALGLWVIDHDDTPGVGLVGLQPVSPTLAGLADMAGGVEPLVALLPTHWGQGIAGAALRALLDRARAEARVERAVAAVDRPNAASHRLMRRMGFQETGTAPGPLYELVLYRLP